MTIFKHQAPASHRSSLQTRVLLAVCSSSLLFATAGCMRGSLEVNKTVADDNLVITEQYNSDVFDKFELKTLPEEDFSHYRRVMITPMTFRISDDVWRDLSDQDKRRLFTDFQRAYRLAYDDVELVNDPDPNTLIINTYVTNLARSDPERNFVPFIIGELDLGAAVFESEALDNTGRVLAVARGVYNGKPLLEGYSDWDVVRHGSREWLKLNRRLLEESGLIRERP